MHVLLIHQAFAGPDEPGGTRHYELARHCAAAGHEFTVVASNVNYQTGRRVEASPPRADGITIRRAWAGPSVQRGFVWRLLSFFCFMAASVLAALRGSRPDVVMGTSPPHSRLGPVRLGAIAATRGAASRTHSLHSILG